MFQLVVGTVGRGQHEQRRDQRARADGLSLAQRVDDGQAHHERVFGRVVYLAVGHETLIGHETTYGRVRRVHGDNGDDQQRR